MLIFRDRGATVKGKVPPGQRDRTAAAPEEVRIAARSLSASICAPTVSVQNLCNWIADLPRPNMENANPCGNLDRLGRNPLPEEVPVERIAGHGQLLRLCGCRELNDRGAGSEQHEAAGLRPADW